jgi:hypothetical protein
VTSYIYLPVDTPEIRSLATAWNNGRTAKGKQAYVVLGSAQTGYAKWKRRQGGNRLLSVVQDTDKLYILAHGYSAVAGGPALSIGAARGAVLTDALTDTWGGGVDKLYSPQSLAQHIAEEGLVKTFMDLRLFACHTGQAAQGSTSFGAQFKRALVAQGYGSVVVTVYLGAVAPKYSFRQVNATNTDYPVYVPTGPMGAFQPDAGKRIAGDKRKGVDRGLGGIALEPASAHRIQY